ncbi:MAG: hypothetical protein JRN26_05620 [Nitrososphaerota archaeon]|jgi:hypothetical protein|nr:hypothetical protein [Nitrososphaerota archaeon]MDG6927204.1 hypothetical protein [Nitrososphaerota archaeon]MDG6930808.1 hypothetical protein [Nitrososphaerota archaeon]MDG6932252.1 hypothetical protein [Nitrososphaerota archaeon]MDG6936343.1 hypothetical protein [Nitrososphaerota archaeon]
MDTINDTMIIVLTNMASFMLGGLALLIMLMTDHSISILIGLTPLIMLTILVDFIIAYRFGFKLLVNYWKYLYLMGIYAVFLLGFNTLFYPQMVQGWFSSEIMGTALMAFYIANLALWGLSSSKYHLKN